MRTFVCVCVFVRARVRACVCVFSTITAIAIPYPPAGIELMELRMGSALGFAARADAVVYCRQQGLGQALAVIGAMRVVGVVSLVGVIGPRVSVTLRLQLRLIRGRTRVVRGRALVICKC